MACVEILEQSWHDYCDQTHLNYIPSCAILSEGGSSGDLPRLLQDDEQVRHGMNAT
jgi:hypothetical protein